jgi:hypothetical protein
MDNPAYDVAGIDVDKRMLAVVVANALDRERQFEGRGFGSTICERQKLSIGLQNPPSRKSGWNPLRHTETSVVRAGGAVPALAGTSPVESRSSRAENRLSGGEAQREPTPERGVDFELRSRGGATGLAHLDPHQISTEAGSGAVAESTGESSGRVSNQTVQRGQRSPRSQWPTDSACHRSWGNGSGTAQRIGRSTVAGDG